MKRWLSVLLCVMLACSGAAFAGCAKTGESGTPGGDNGTPPTEDPEKKLSDPIQLVVDPCFTRGFNVKGQKDGLGTVFGKLGYDDGKTYDPAWSLAQWYCGYYHRQGENYPAEYDILNADKTQNGNLTMWKDASKTLRVDPTVGSVYMKLEATKEYTAPKTESGPWPHLLLEYGLTAKQVSKLDSLRLKTDYTLTAFKDGMGGAADPDVHCAQFPFYVVVRNRNEKSEDYGRYIWFGASLYDNRYDYTLTFASADIGSDDKLSTNAFIYKPGGKEYLSAPVEKGEVNSIDWDMLPYIETAFETAQQNGYLQNTNYEDLYVTSGNFGWEITGTYDAAVQMDKFEIWAVEELADEEQ